MNLTTVPIEIGDPINARILAVSEDKLQGFQRNPFGEIARLSGVELPVVLERVQAMLKGGTIRRVRQTLMATNLAPGALVAWQVPVEKLDAAFDYMFQQDPFLRGMSKSSGRRTPATPGSNYKLWTTLKVPQGYSMRKHGEFLLRQTGAEHFRLMPAKRLFALGVGHMRRRGMEIWQQSGRGGGSDGGHVNVVKLNELEWRVLTALKREFESGRDHREPVAGGRADEAGRGSLKNFLTSQRT